MSNQVHAPVQLERRAVLVISSNQWTAQLIRTLLSAQGLRDVLLAASGAEAAERLVSPIDLLIADSGPATIDGIAVLQELRRSSDPRTATIPALLLCPEAAVKGHVPPALLELCKTVGVRGIVTKPVVPAKLFEHIFRVLPQDTGARHNLEPEVRNVSELLARQHFFIYSSNKFMSQLLRNILFSAGAKQIVIAETTEIAQHRLREELYTLVIVDSGPGNVDGLFLAAWLRGPLPSKTAADCPLLVLSAKPSAEFVAQARALQASAIVAKPIVGRVLLNRVVKALTPPEMATEGLSSADADGNIWYVK